MNRNLLILIVLMFIAVKIPMTAQQEEAGRVPLPDEGFSKDYENIIEDTQYRMNQSPQWLAFLEKHGTWNAMWNEWTKTPSRVWGEGYQVPGVVSIDKSNVETVSRQFLRTFSNLLRCDESLLELVDAHMYLGKWAVSFQQIYKGIPVHFSDVILRMSDRGRVFLFGSDFYPELAVKTIPTIATDDAKRAAMAGLSMPPIDVSTIEGGALSILPVKSIRGITYHLTYEFTVTEDEFHIWKTWIDAHDGKVLWRYNQVIEGIGGQVTANVKTVSVIAPASTTNIFHQYMNVSGTNVTTDMNGMYTSTGSGTTIAQLRGPYAKVARQDAADAIVQQSVPNNGTFNVHWADNNSHTAERTTFYNAVRTRDYIVSMDPSITAMNYQMLCKVNVNNYCNANFDGNGINFYKAGTVTQGTCANTGDMPDVVMHEYGHAVNHKVYIQFGKSSGMSNSALHEALADATASLILDRPEMGIGFWGASTVLRNLNNTNRYPENIINESHNDGLILGGAIWDMRLNVGLTSASRLVHFARHGKPDDTNTGKAFTKYFLEVLTVDDNDANLANGTPNSSQIVPAFAKHGIPSGMLSIAHTKVSDKQGNTTIPITASVTSALSNITTQAVRVYYRTMGGVWSSVSMTMTSGTPGTTSNWAGSIPPQMSGTIIEYYIEAQESWGTTKMYPAEGANAPMRILIGFTSHVLYDFEQAGQGWQAHIQGDDAITGKWTRVNPVGTFVNSMPVQPEDDHTTAPGVYCYVTGNGVVNGPAGDADVDEGQTTLLSPAINVLNFTVPVIRYWRWFSNDLGAAPGTDPWVVQISSDNGSSWVTVENTYKSFNYWSENVIRIADFVTPSANVMIKFVARDDDPQSLVEAAVDDVEVLYVQQIPVELIGFSATRSEKEIELSWKTATELNNYGFEVQYQYEDEEEWKAAGFMNGHGTTNREQQYGFTFFEPYNKDILFRLKQIDLDGSVVYSSVVRVAGSGVSFTLHQNYPNPFNPNTTVTFELPAEMKTRLIVKNVLGNTVLTKDLGLLRSGQHHAMLEMSDFPSGMYIYQLEADRNILSRTMMLAK